MNAIPTIYNGYKFRSRLEARWAVFFDAMGIEYEYEPEGFYGSSGLYYLPDFYLSNLNVYVEVKGLKAFSITYKDGYVKFDNGREDPTKVALFIREMHKDHHILVVFGDPVDAFYGPEHGGKGESHLFFEAMCAPLFFKQNSDPKIEIECSDHDCKHCNRSRWLSSSMPMYIDKDAVWFAVKDNEWMHFLPADPTHITSVFYKEGDISTLSNVPEKEKLEVFRASTLKARQARFEHGENPKV